MAGTLFWPLTIISVFVAILGLYAIKPVYVVVSLRADRAAVALLSGHATVWDVGVDVYNSICCGGLSIAKTKMAGGVARFC